MQPLLKSCCGLDVHKSMVLACIAHGPLDKPPKFEIGKMRARERKKAAKREEAIIISKRP